MELYYPCSKNKDTDHLCSYCEDDLRLCFCKCKLLVSTQDRSFTYKTSVKHPLLQAAHDLRDPSGNDFRRISENNTEKIQRHESVFVIKLATIMWNQRTYMSRLVGKPTMWFPNRSDTNRPVQAQKRARSLKFRI